MRRGGTSLLVLPRIGAFYGPAEVQATLKQASSASPYFDNASEFAAISKMILP